MTLEPWMVYLVGEASSVVVVFFAFGLIFTLATIVQAFNYDDQKWDMEKEDAVQSRRNMVRTFVLALVSFFLCAITPSTKTAAAMLVLPPIVNSEAVQTLPKELTDLAREWIRELKPAHRESNV